eukprot:CAMPEP_0117446764 /NCGR_PEP_ID=MMETSP0759-20121206/6516_1 /TAXON_ID=63605 /ORGANISM="Percolomonas cosmopolitus, Strain WS" /LENGTH=217 /DNA_ID=CAMNT_0005239055 /DNA_START=29 /DNA_END=682 /DNA_ORIENTATION=-
MPPPHKKSNHSSSSKQSSSSSSSSKPSSSSSNTPLHRQWNLFTKSPDNSIIRITAEPLSSAEQFLKYFILLDKATNLGQKMELFAVQDGMILEEDKSNERHDDDRDDEKGEPMKWTVRYGLRATKTNVDALWRDLAFATIGETLPESERVVAVSVSLFPLYGVVSLHVLDPELKLPVERADRKAYLEKLVPKELVTVQWKTIFDFSENLKSMKEIQV